jgi:hypothetical protein
LVDVDVVILSIQLNRIPSVASLVARLPRETVVIDTSNYYPFRDEKIDAIERGQVESLWVSEQLGRPIATAWNAPHISSKRRKHLLFPVGQLDVFEPLSRRPERLLRRQLRFSVPCHSPSAQSSAASAFGN